MSRSRYRRCPASGARLQDILDDGPLDITMHDGFEFWLDEDAVDDPEVRASLERANASIYPTVRMAAAHAAYWCRVPDRAHMRWVLPDDEDQALDALARLSRRRRAAARRRHQVRRHVPRARPARARCGTCRRTTPAAGVGGAAGRLREALRRRAGAGRHRADRRRNAAPARA